MKYLGKILDTFFKTCSWYEEWVFRIQNNVCRRQRSGIIVGARWLAKKFKCPLSRPALAVFVIGDKWTILFPYETSLFSNNAAIHKMIMLYGCITTASYVETWHSILCCISYLWRSMYLKMLQLPGLLRSAKEMIAVLFEYWYWNIIFDGNPLGMLQ